jgi:hypothetical protein
MAEILWHIGNTTVRTPYRLKEALQALKNSEFHGNLVGTAQEEGFAKLLHDRGIVFAERISREETAEGAGDLGRKWRIALGQLGFVMMHKIGLFGAAFPGLPGRLYEITPNGYRLMAAESTAEQQECFLRALAAYKIPSILEKRYNCSPFSPLRFVLQVLLELEKISEEAAVIHFTEMALFVQQRTPGDGLEKVITEILAYRIEREKAGNKKKYDAKRLLEVVGEKKKKLGP